jgi:aconitase A
LTDAPNPGFARAVLSLEVVVTSIVGYFIVSDSHATLKQGLGMVAILVGTFAVVPTK